VSILAKRRRFSHSGFCESGRWKIQEKTLALIEWTEAYSVNVDLFDKHHQHLFDLLNTLHECMREGKSREVIEEVLNALVDYAERHFAAEEDLMRRTMYPDMQAHAVEHRKFYVTVSRLQKQHQADLPARSHEVVTLIQEWLKNHILKTDRAYGPHMVEHQVRG
jgi:hemerythrin